MSWKLQNLASGTGWAKLGLLILAGLIMVNAGRAQTNLASAQVLTGDYGSVTNNNLLVVPAPGAPNIAGFAPFAPLWYQWTAPSSGEVELDTIGSAGAGRVLDTVLAVFTGASFTSLNQVAANDDLFPINKTITASSEAYTESGSGDYAQFAPPNTEPVYGYTLPYYGPSHLRFNAQAGVTYYFAVDSKSSRGNIVLNWAYQSSGVFRFATEDLDYTTQLPLYQTSETESDYVPHYVPNGNSVLYTYYKYNAPGVLVTVTRVAGSTGRAWVNYSTVDGANLTNSAGAPLPLPGGDVGAVGGIDYTPVSGTLVFDDYEMSKTILIPIIDVPATARPGDQTNRVFGVELASATLDPLESGDVSPPRVDPNFGVALVKILNVDADPYGPDVTPSVTTNYLVDTNFVPPLTNFAAPIYITNLIPALYPTNPIVNFQKCNFRVPEDINDPANPNSQTTVTIYVARSTYATNTSAISLHYRINNFLNDSFDASEEWNNWFPLQPGSDYAVPTPATQSGDLLGTNSDFNMVQGDLSFPANGADEFYQPITFTVTNSTLTKFNRDFKIEFYQEISVNSQTVPALAGMVGETTVTILFNDQHPPAGSVDELYNADFNRDLALPPAIVPITTPQNDPNPGVAGLVNSLLVLPNNETLIAGDFSSYNGSTFNSGHPINSIALLATNGALDQSFSPNSGADDGPVNAMALTSGNQYIVGGNFTSFNGTPRGYVARVNADGSLDMGFNASADNNVRAVAVQPDGKVLIGGDFQNVNGVPRNYLARLNTDGSLDTTFNPSNTLGGSVYALALPPAVITSIVRNAVGNSNEDDQPINLGNYTSGTLTVNYNMFTAPDDMRIFYGDTNVAAGSGVLIYDTGFVSGSNTLVIPFGPVTGTSGLLTTNLITIVMNQGGQTVTTGWTYKASVAPSVSSSGIFVGGNFGVSGQNYSDVARFTTNGSLDTTFNPLSGADDPVYALGWQVDGKLVVGGAFTHFNGISLNRLARLNVDGSLDTTNFFPGTGANDVVWNITLQPLDGTMYVGGQFSSFNGTHRLGFTRLYPNGTVDTTFLDTAYNQFAGLKKIYSYDTPAVYASGVQSDGNVMIGGSFNQVGGGQADANVCNSLDDELGIQESFGDTNLWVEPKVRDGVRNRSGIARLIGGSTPGPGNISLQTASFSANKSQSVLSVGLVRTNGVLGPVSANFSVQPGTAQSGMDYLYNSTPPLYWIAWRFTTTTITRCRGDGLFGINGFLQDVFGSLSLADALINNQSDITLSIIKDTQNPGNLNAQFQLANPSGANEFYLGGQNIPLGAALGPSAAPFTLIDDSEQYGTFGFSSSTLCGHQRLRQHQPGPKQWHLRHRLPCEQPPPTEPPLQARITLALPIMFVSFPQGTVTNSFTVTIRNNGCIYTNFVEKTINLRLSSLARPGGGDAMFGISNAVLRLINPNFQGYLTLNATNFIGSESAGFITFVVNRVAGSEAPSPSNMPPPTARRHSMALIMLARPTPCSWNNGDVSSRIGYHPAHQHRRRRSQQIVRRYPVQSHGERRQHTGAFLRRHAAHHSIINATLLSTTTTATACSSSARPLIIVNENGGYATITVIRTGGAAGPVSVNFATSNGPNASSGKLYSDQRGSDLCHQPDRRQLQCADSGRRRTGHRPISTST